MRSKGISHCDIKPENIMYVTDASSKSGYRFIIGDFGNAVKSSTVDFRIQTNHYRCPENLLNPTCTDVRACDFFSIGCIIYEAITAVQLIQYERLFSDTVKQEDDKQLLAALHLVGVDYVKEFPPCDLDYTPFLEKVTTIKGSLERDVDLLSAFQDMHYVHGDEWIAYIKSMLIPFPMERLKHVDNYPVTTHNEVRHNGDDEDEDDDEDFNQDCRENDDDFRRPDDDENFYQVSQACDY